MSRRLQVSVWHLGVLGRRAFLGEVVVPLATWDFKDDTTQSARWYLLQTKVTSGWGLGAPCPATRASSFPRHYPLHSISPILLAVSPKPGLGTPLSLAQHRPGRGQMLARAEGAMPGAPSPPSWCLLLGREVPTQRLHFWKLGVEAVLSCVAPKGHEKLLC